MIERIQKFIFSLLDDPRSIAKAYDTSLSVFRSTLREMDLLLGRIDDMKEQRREDITVLENEVMRLEETEAQTFSTRTKIADLIGE
jgi:hypothetical protein